MTEKNQPQKSKKQLRDEKLSKNLKANLARRKMAGKNSEGIGK